MDQTATTDRQERVHIGCFVDRVQRDRLFELARLRDCSVSRIVRKAITVELDRDNKGPK